MSVQTDLAEFQKKLEKQIKQKLDSKFMLELGAEAIEIIKTRTRAGFGVKKSSGVKEELKALSDKYIQQRRNMRLSRFTTPETSNVTQTGKMLASLRARKVGDSIEVGPGKQQRSDSEHTNEEIAEFLLAQGRVFMNLSKQEFQELLRIAKKKLGFK